MSEKEHGRHNCDCVECTEGSKQNDLKILVCQNREEAYSAGLAFGKSLCSCSLEKNRAGIAAAYKASADECKRSEAIWRQWGNEVGRNSAEGAKGLAERISAFITNEDKDALEDLLTKAKEEGRQQMRDELSAAVKVLLNWKENTATDSDMEEARRRLKSKEIK